MTNTERKNTLAEREQFLRYTPDFCERTYMTAEQSERAELLADARERAQELGCLAEFDESFRAKLREESKLNHLTVLDPLNCGYNDRGTSELFAKLYRDELRYSVTAKEWYHYNGAVWEKDAGGMAAHKLAKEFFDLLIRHSISITDEAERQQFYGYYVRYGSKNKRDVLIKDSADTLCITGEQFDRDVNLLNFRNGTLELDSMRFREHSPDDLITKMCNADYDRGAKSELWERFVEEVMPHDREKQRFLQKALGYALTGRADLERLFIFYGASTRNGKSTMLSTVGYALGDYAANTPPETLAMKKKDSRTASEDLARLAGVRFLNVSEPPQSMAFDVALVKSLTGGDTITARRLFENSFEYIPQFTIFINTNYLPKVTDDSLFTSNRVNVITFDRHFEPGEQDITLKQKLRSPENVSAVINWLTEGLELYRKEGMLLPISVGIATREYAQNSDKFEMFLGECLEEDSTGAVTAKDAYNRYREWCRTNGYFVENKGRFMDMLRKRDLLSETGTIGGKTAFNVINGYIMASK